MKPASGQSPSEDRSAGAARLVRGLSILQVAIAKGWRGGQVQVLSLARGLCERGHDCAIVTDAREELGRRALAAGVPVEHVPLGRGWTPRTVLPFARALWKRRPDVVHLHGATHHPLGFLSRWIARTPLTLISRREMRPIRSVRRYRVCADLLLVVSEAVAEACRASGYPPERIRVVPDGVDPSRFLGARAVLRDELGLASEQPLLLTLSALNKDKDLPTLLAAFRRVRARLPEARLAVAGKGAREPELKALAEEIGLDGSVRFLGHREDAADLLASADVYVQSSVREGLGSAILEAMASRRAVVATAAGGVPEAVVDGVTGRLVPPGDPEALASATLALLADPEGRRRMGEAGAERVRASFTLDRMVESTLAAYRAAAR